MGINPSTPRSSALYQFWSSSMFRICGQEERQLSPAEGPLLRCPAGFTQASPGPISQRRAWKPVQSSKGHAYFLGSAYSPRRATASLGRRVADPEEVLIHRLSFGGAGARFSGSATQTPSILRGLGDRSEVPWFLSYTPEHGGPKSFAYQALRRGAEVLMEVMELQPELSTW